MRAYLYSVIILFMAACHKDNNDNRNFTSEDRDFMITASYANRARIALGTWAATKGSTESIRTFGQTMALYYQQAQNDLYYRADSLRYILPHQPDAAHLAFATELSSLSGPAFDSAYINNELVDLQAMLQLYEDKNNSEGDAQVRSYAGQNIPAIKDHQKGAELLIP